jgi:hypothetical protein
LAEQGTLNPKVGGSIPPRPTPESPGLSRVFAFPGFAKPEACPQYVSRRAYDLPHGDGNSARDGARVPGRTSPGPRLVCQIPPARWAAGAEETRSGVDGPGSPARGVLHQASRRGLAARAAGGRAAGHPPGHGPHWRRPSPTPRRGTCATSSTTGAASPRRSVATGRRWTPICCRRSALCRWRR